LFGQRDSRRENYGIQTTLPGKFPPPGQYYSLGQDPASLVPPGYPSIFTRESKDTTLNELLSSVLQLQPYRGPEGAGPAMFCGKTLKFREKWD